MIREPFSVVTATGSFYLISAALLSISFWHSASRWGGIDGGLVFLFACETQEVRKHSQEVLLLM